MGFGGFFIQGGAVVALLLGAALLRRQRVAASLAMLVAAGVLVAVASSGREGACRARLAALSEWTSHVRDAVSEGDFVRTTLSAQGCDLDVAMAVARGAAQAGQRVRIQGRVTQSDRGLLIQNATVAVTGRRAPLMAMRAASGRAIDRLFGDRAPVVRALLIADSRQIDRGLRERFADAGMVHMLAISGLHVAIVAAAATLLLSALRLPLSVATFGSVILTAFYVLIIGAPAPAVRAAAMLFAYAVSRMLQRPTSPWAVLAIGALVPLANPESVSGLGYQLSLMGMVGLICAGRVTSRLTAKLGNDWTTRLASAAIATVFASLATAPIVAWHFGRVSLIAPLTNLVGAPILLLLQPMLFAALLLSPIPPLARFVADAARPLIRALELVAEKGSLPGFAAIDIAPTLTAVTLAAVCVAGVLGAALAARPARAFIVAATAATALIWMPVLRIPGPRQLMEIHLIDVGQGDAIAVRLPDRRWLLFDSGRSWSSGDAGRHQIIPYLRRRGGSLFAFVLSHPHSDHVGGAASVVRWLKPDIYWDAAYVAANNDYLASLRRAEEMGTQWRRVHPGDSVAMGSVTMTFLAPDSAWAANLGDPNEASTVAMLRYGNVRFLVTGDAERAEEDWLVERYGGRLRADVLKVAHHGSRTSSTPAFVEAVRPAIALVSVGAANRYGHPSDSVVARLSDAGAIVLRTDKLGSVVLRTDGSRIWVEALGEEWPVDCCGTATPAFRGGR
jgi:competence protein ComEC